MQTTRTYTFQSLCYASLLLLTALSCPSNAHNGDQTAYAVPLSGITIDGRLDDWPDEMAIYPIEWVHPTAYQPTPPRGPHDLTASFRVGYDADSDLLFLAVVVRDDEIVVYPTSLLWHSQDQCEIYLDADHSGGDAVSDGWTVAPGEERKYRKFPRPSTEEKASDRKPSSPTLSSGVAVVSRRVGDLLVYEWAIPIHTSFPEERLDIRPGERIGFDIAICDADDSERGNWVAWTPEGGKVNDSGLFGDLVFAEEGAPAGVTTGPTMPPDADRVGRISGRVSFAGHARATRVQLLEDGEAMSSTWTDTAGVYRLEAREGHYALQAFAGADTVRREVHIQTGRDDTLDLSFQGLTRTARGTGPGDDAGGADEQGGIFVAVMAPVEGILVDGDLADWPEDIDEQVVGTTRYGEFWWDTDLDVQAARGPADLEARVRFGYDSDRQILYGGVTVRDDSHILVEEGAGSDFDEIRVTLGIPTLRDTVVGVELRIEPSASDSSWRTVFMRSKEGMTRRAPEGVTAYACSVGDSVYVYEFLVHLGRAAARFQDWPSIGPLRASVLVADVDADGSFTAVEWGRPWEARGWLIPSGSPASTLSAAIYPVLRQADSLRWDALRTYVPVTAGVVIAVIHLFLFAFYPAAKENLAMAALALAGVCFLVLMGSHAPSDLYWMVGLFLAWSIFGLGYWLLHEVLSMPLTRRFWVYVAAVLLSAATHVAHVSYFIPDEVFLVASSLLLLELFRVIVAEALRGNREGLLVGMAFLAFSGLFFSAEAWALWGQGEASLMLMTVLLSMHLARRAARTSRLLARANAEIEEATRNKSQFLRRMSHDLRSPMNAIIGYTRLLRRRLADRIDEREARNLENIGTSSNNLLNLINDILDLSRIEAGRSEVNVQPVDVRQLAEECADALESIVKPGVELRRELGHVGEVSTDPERLRQVVMNLLGNATKFTDEGSVTLSVSRVGGAAELSVADTGIGIPPEDLPHIFAEFRQVERQGGEQTEGTGLGLAIAKKTVELLGGEISATSEAGAGTTFTLRIGDFQPAASP